MMNAIYDGYRGAIDFAGQKVASAKEAFNHALDSAGNGLSAAKDMAGTVAQAAQAKIGTIGTSVYNFEPNHMDSRLDGAVLSAQNTAVDAVKTIRSFRDKVTGDHISHFNNNEIKLFGLVGKTDKTTRSAKVMNAIIDFKNSTGKAGDAASRGAAKGAYAITRAITSPLGFIIGPNGEAASAAIATGVASAVRAVGAVVTAILSYLPELVGLAALGAAAYFGGTALATLSTLALIIGSLVALDLGLHTASLAAIHNLTEYVRGQQETIEGQKGEINTQQQEIDTQKKEIGRLKKTVEGNIQSIQKVEVNIKEKDDSQKEAGTFTERHPKLTMLAKGSAYSAAALGALVGLAYGGQALGYNQGMDLGRAALDKAAPYALSLRDTVSSARGLAMLGTLYNTTKDNSATAKIPTAVLGGIGG